MKLYISTDIEGITGVTSWSETDILKSESKQYVFQLEQEITKICNLSKKMGFNEIIVKDAHETGRNISHKSLPKYVKLIKGFSGHPLCMLEGLDNTYDAIAFIGYHSASLKGTSPLSHTLHVSRISTIKINNIIASEFLIHYYAGLYFGVPVIFVSGDKGICEEVQVINSKIATVITKEGFGKSTINKHPDIVLEQIQETFAALQINNLNNYLEKLPEYFTVEIEYKNPAIAYWASFYPNAILKNDTTIQFKTNDYMDVLRLFSFVIPM